MDQAAVRCKGIKKTYGKDENKVEALKNTDLDLFCGQLTLIVGPSGSGKTTLISIIATILKPDEGELILLDEDIGRMSENDKARFRRKHVGMVFQSLFLMPTLTILENVSLPLIISGYSEETANKKAKELLEVVHLTHRSNVSPALLSKGQQQRVAIARAMVNDSSIIICDEPTSSLDHATGFEIMELLHHLALHSSRVILVVTHDPRILSYGDRVISMSDGQIISTESSIKA